MPTVNDLLGMGGKTTRDLTALNLKLVQEIANELTLNELTRTELQRRVLGAGERNIDQECGYITTPQITSDRLYDLYKRDPIARRVIEIWPKECWKKKPELFDDDNENSVSEFEGAFHELCKHVAGESWAAAENAQNKFWSILEQADIYAGIGYYGVAVLGLDDDAELNQPIAGLGEEDDITGPNAWRITSNARKRGLNLNYIQPYSHLQAEAVSFDSNRKSRRFGQPTQYRITAFDQDTKAAEILAPASSYTVHWSRVVHLVDSPFEGDVFSDPRILVMYNRLYDLAKLYGGSAEMYWLGALPGIKFEPKDKDIVVGAPEIAAIKGMVDDYLNGLRRFLASDSLNINTLSPTVVDPKSQIEVQIDAICIALGIPKRVFMGSERGELASTQDQTAFDGRVEARRTSQVGPRIINPLIDRLIMLGILPKPKEEGYKIKWPSLTEKTAGEKADIATKFTSALAMYVKGELQNLMTPLDYLVKVHGMDVDEVEEMLNNARKLKIQSEPGEEEEQANDQAKAVQNPPKETQTQGKKTPANEGGKTPPPGTPPQPAGKPGSSKPPIREVNPVLTKNVRTLLEFSTNSLSEKASDYALETVDEFGWSELTNLKSSKKLVTNSKGKETGKVLNKPFRTPKGPKKFGVYVKNDQGNVVLVRFGDPGMEIKRDSSERRKSFRARHGCDTDPGPKWKAKYWACKTWEKSKTVSDVVANSTGCGAGGGKGKPGFQGGNTCAVGSGRGGRQGKPAPTMKKSKSSVEGWGRSNNTVTWEEAFGGHKTSFKAGGRRFVAKYTSSPQVDKFVDTSVVVKKKIKVKAGEFDFTTEKGSWQLTKEGNAKEVVRRSVEVLGSAIQEFSPDVITFSSAKYEKGRLSLYKFLTKRADKVFPEYEGHYTRGSGEYEYFALIKKTIDKSVLRPTDKLTGNSVQFDVLLEQLTLNATGCGSGSKGKPGFQSSNVCAVGSGRGGRQGKPAPSMKPKMTGDQKRFQSVVAFKATESAFAIAPSPTSLRLHKMAMAKHLSLSKQPGDVHAETAERHRKVIDKLEGLTNPKPIKFEDLMSSKGLKTELGHTAGIQTGAKTGPTMTKKKTFRVKNSEGKTIYTGDSWSGSPSNLISEKKKSQDAWATTQLAKYYRTFLVKTPYKTLVGNAAAGCGASGGKGKPGFQPGNSCAKGGGSAVSSSTQVVKAAHLKKGMKIIAPDGSGAKSVVSAEFAHDNGETYVLWKENDTHYKGEYFDPNTKIEVVNESDFPEDITKLEYVKALGGSTGAQLMKDPATGNLFVQKTGAHEDHVINEHQTNLIYAAAGVAVPQSMIGKNASGETVMVSKFIEGKSLGSLSGPEKEAAYKKLQEDFALDATLGNWDVVGASEDNILVGNDGKVYRIDNGGSMKYRAQGGDKGSLWDDQNTEVKTMRTNPKNPSAMKAFGLMTDADVVASFDKHMGNLQQIIDSAPATEKTKLGSRFVNGHKQVFAGGAAKTTGPSVHEHLNSGDALGLYISKNKGKVGLTSVAIEKIKYLNPNGIQDGVFYLPDQNPAADAKKAAHLAKVLPEGTQIKVIVAYSLDKIKVGKGVGKVLNTTTADGSLIKPQYKKPTFQPSVTAPTNSLGQTTKPLKPNNVFADTFPGSKTVKFGSVSPDGIETGSHINLVSDTTPVNKAAVKKHWEETMTAGEKSALASWKSSARDFRERQNKGAGYLTQKDVDLRTMLNKASKYEGTVFRGFHGSEYVNQQIELINKVGVGGYWGEHTPMCTSRNASTAKSFASGDVLLKLHVKSGAYVGPVVSHSNEDEVIARPGVYYKIRRIVNNAVIDGKNHKLYVEMEES